MDNIVVVKNMGVIWFIFHVPQVHRLDLHNETCFALANLQSNICKNWIEYQISPYLVKLIESIRLLILNMLLYDASSWMLTKPYTNQI